MSEFVPYPNVRRIIEAAFERKRSAEPGVSIRSASAFVDVSPSTFHGWIKGTQAPQAKKLDKLVEYLHPGNELDDQLERDTLRKQLLQASVRAPHREPAVRASPLDKIEHPPASLNVGVVNYSDFGWRDGREDGFFDLYFSRFAAYAGLLSLEDVEFEPREAHLPDTPTMLCETEELDVVTAILATPDRARLMDFYTLPIRIPVNAVYLRSALEDREEEEEDIRNALLTFPQASAARDDLVYPIANEMEVGGLHVRNFLQLSAKKNECKFTDYDLLRFAELLETVKSGGRVPLVIADEVMCARLVAYFMEEDKTDRVEDCRASLLFRSDEDACSSQIELGMPKYRLGLAVNKHHTDWAEYLKKSLFYFEDANPELVSTLYKRLALRLTRSFVKVYRRSLVGANPQYDSGPLEWLGLDSYLRNEPSERQRDSPTTLIGHGGDPWDHILPTVGRSIREELSVISKEWEQLSN